MKQIMQDAKARIVQAFADLKEKERVLRENARERAQWLAQQRKGGMDPATN
jgi:hypothetical protein